MKKLISFNSLFVFLCIIFIILTFILNREYFSDDAYITLKYVKNLTEGNGLVWNLDEKIQGYTNFFHLISIFLVNILVNNLKNSVYIVNFIVYLSFLVIIFKHKYFDVELKFKTLLYFLIACSAPIIVWTLGGLESVMFSLFLFLGIIEYESSRENKLNYLLSGLYFSLATLTRPDGLMFYGLIGLFILFKNKNIKEFSLFLIPSLLIILYAIFVYNYYGNIVPNTFYAKSYGLGFFKIEFGLKYFYYILTRPPFFIPILIFLKIITKNYRLNYLDTILLIYLIYLIQSGGDHMFSFRFYSHIIPLVSLRIYQLIKDNNTINIKIFKVIIVIAFYMQLMIQLIVPMKPDPAADIGKKVGIHINKYWEDGSLIALATAGSTPFYAPNNRYIDMLGLLDTTISKRKVDKIVARFQGMTGHSKGDGKYILSRKPDYIIVGPAQGTKDDIHFLSDYELLNSEEFNNKYVMQIDTVRELNDTIIFTYFVRNEK